MSKTQISITQSLFLILLSVFIGSCAKQTKSETEVYQNDFESGNLNNIANGKIESYNGTNVLGRYNAGGFGLTVDNLPKHDLVIISFDLYIHGSWDGNKPGVGGVDGPDIWIMLVDHNSYINTTFSNYPCSGGFCQPQSYPANYPNFDHNPKTGAEPINNLPTVCGSPFGTTLYKIQKTINHTSSKLLFQCTDQLIQSNVPPLDRICDESWSVDNIKIKTVAL